jgi:hypothetical protein
MTKLDPNKATPIIEAVQKEMQTEVATAYQRVQTNGYYRVYAAAYEQAERDYKVGKFAEKQ